MWPDPHALYLTFDDGPDPAFTPRLLDVLAAAGARATFFVLGEAVRRHPALARRLLAEGHEVGNHGWRHLHPWTLGATRARAVVRDGHAAIADALGRAPRWYRPAHGRLRRCMIDEAAARGTPLVLWSRSAVDWGPRARAHGVAARLSAGTAGDVLLMHDGRRRHNRPDVLTAVLPGVLAGFRARGLAAAPLTAAVAARYSRDARA